MLCNQGFVPLSLPAHSRFWYVMQSQQVEFTTLPVALSYLRATLNGMIIDTLRFHSRSREVLFQEPGLAQSLK